MSLHSQVFADLFETKIEPEEIFYVVKEMVSLHDNGQHPDWYSALAILADRYKDAEERRKVFCIIERMECTSKLATDKRMRGWSMEGIEEGCLITNEAVFRAAALCPLRLDGNRVYFDPDEFFNIVLEESESEGWG